MTKTEFQQAAYKLLTENGKLLIFLRIPNSGNSRHYFFVDNKEDFNDFLSTSKPSDSITIFKSYNELCTGLITKDFIDNSLKILATQNIISEILILEDSYKDKSYAEWHCVESIEELKDVLKENFGNNVTIILEPDFCDELNTFHLYVPDKKGISKPGNTY